MHSFTFTCHYVIFAASRKQYMRLPLFVALEKLPFIKFVRVYNLDLLVGMRCYFIIALKHYFFCAYWQFDFFFPVDFLFILYIHLFLSFFFYHFFGVIFYMVLIYICCQLCVLKYLIPGWGFSVISVHPVLWRRGIFHFTAAKYVGWSLLIHQHFN